MRKELSAESKLFVRNSLTFSLGGIGRDMAYNLWSNFIVVAILLTKGLDTKQFAILSVIIIVCRIFDAINDPIMGGIIEATSTRFGKFKPWIMIGVLTNSVILFATFAAPLHGNDFLIFFPFAYILWDITFTMNDIAYWSMMPALTSNEKHRNILVTMANLCAAAGGGAVGLFVPLFTNGDLAIGGNAVNAYKIIPAFIAVLFILCQILTCIGVKERPEYKMIVPKSERTGLKHMFRVLKGNDQLQWMAFSSFFYNIGSIILLGIITYYIYFTYGYDGAILTIFSIISGITGAITVIYPFLAKKFTRRQITKICLIILTLGYLSMLVVGLTWHHSKAYLLLAVCATFTSIGQGIYYMVMTIAISNTVEYNEYKTGKRDEGIIYSIRPFMAKMGSALQMGIIALIFGILKVADITKGISDIENSAALGTITNADKITQINAIIAGVPNSTKDWLLVCMTVLPVLFIASAIIIFLKKYKIDEKFYGEMLVSIEAAKAEKAGLTQTSPDSTDSIDSTNSTDSTEVTECSGASDKDISGLSEAALVEQGEITTPLNED